MPYTTPLTRSPCSSRSEKIHFDLPWPLHTEPAGVSATTSSFEDAAIASESEDEAEHGQHRRPRVLRKLSGEIVRPILRPTARTRPASEPPSPTATKSVNFHSHLEETVDFFRLDCPMSINAGSRLGYADKASLEYPAFRPQAACQWEMVTPNFQPQSTFHQSRFVCLKKLRLLADQKSLQGVVAVRNAAYHKSVTCRFTFDNWKTTSNVDARYCDRVALEKAPFGYDFFVFTIELSDILHLESKIAHLCVRYIVNGQEFWDNNSGRNFEVCFFKKILPRQGDVPAHGISLHPQNELSKNHTPRRSTTGSLRGLDWREYYSISASLDATVRAGKRNDAWRKNDAPSRDTAVVCFKSSFSSFSQRSTISSLSEAVS